MSAPCRQVPWVAGTTTAMAARVGATLGCLQLCLSVLSAWEGHDWHRRQPNTNSRIPRPRSLRFRGTSRTGSSATPSTIVPRSTTEKSRSWPVLRKRLIASKRSA